jgi:peptide/nickel transport system permease protein
MWLLALELGLFPVGRFLTPALWRDAPVDANRVFIWIIVSAVAIFTAWYLSRRFAGRLGAFASAVTPIAAVGAGTGIVVVAWMMSGNANLAADILWHMALPVITLTLISFGGTMLLTRNSMVEVMTEDFVLAARAKGLDEKTVRDRHVARNAMLPIITSLIFNVALAIDGSIVIEAVFSWPGMGMTLVEAAQSEDIPLAMGAFGLVGILALLAHLVADLAYAFLDPRIRY